jgi:hypothetical protein
MVAESNEISQQVAGLLGGQLKELPIALDPQSAKDIEMQHRPARECPPLEQR